ncbi:MAG: cysteine desulfurase [Sphingobacteriia bacterium]|nr:cysteine desulfurase [Sphingobacteriia bacterium]
MYNGRIYFDTNSTTPLNSSVIQKMNEMAGIPLNPSSIHSFGREARKVLEEAKVNICKLLNIDQKKYHVVFTSSGTEANNWVFKGLEEFIPVISAVEHISVLSSAGENKLIIKVDSNGIIDLKHLEEILQTLKNENHKNVIISVIYANNETGVIQPINEIIEIAKKYGAIVHSDMIQAIGKTYVNFNELDLDLFTISAHKINGPVGIAALFIKRNLPIKPMFVGGGQNQGLRAGTENVIGVIGLKTAIEEAISNLNEYILHCKNLRDYIEENIFSITKDAKFIGKNVERLPNTSSIYMPGVSNETQLISFDMESISVSAGSACSSGRIAASHVLIACGIGEQEAKNIIRVSLGIQNNKDEADKFINLWRKIYENNQRKVA